MGGFPRNRFGDDVFPGEQSCFGEDLLSQRTHKHADNHPFGSTSVTTVQTNTLAFRYEKRTKFSYLQKKLLCYVSPEDRFYSQAKAETESSLFLCYVFLPKQNSGSTHRLSCFFFKLIKHFDLCFVFLNFTPAEVTKHAVSGQSPPIIQ